MNGDGYLLEVSAKSYDEGHEAGATEERARIRERLAEHWIRDYCGDSKPHDPLAIACACGWGEHGLYMCLSDWLDHAIGAEYAGV